LNLKQSPRKNNRIYLSIEKSYRDKTTGKPRAKTIKSLGYLDVLEKEYKDPIAHFKEVARKMTEEENKEKKVTLSINMEEKLSPNTKNRKNFGYAAILKIYHELGLDDFFKNKARHENFEYNPNAKAAIALIPRVRGLFFCGFGVKVRIIVNTAIINSNIFFLYYNNFDIIDKFSIIQGRRCSTNS
jgi:hypothetical protein